MKNVWIAAARFLGIGWVIGGCIAGGFFGGMWVGRELGMSEVFFGFVGILIGLIVSAYSIYSGYSLLSKGQEKDEDEEK